LLTFAAPAAVAQSVTNGEALYKSICISCHSLPPVGGAILGANNPGLIRQAINGLVPDMKLVVGPLNFSDAQLADIAAYIATVVSGSPPAANDIDYSDLWWNPNENGWGFNIVQHGAGGNIFSVMYTYDTDGRPLWFVLPGGSWSSSTLFTGAWYRVVGPAFTSPFDASQVNATQVGTATVTFIDASHASLSFTVNGTTVVKPITRQPF
jgi:cytochrome c553